MISVVSLSAPLIPASSQPWINTFGLSLSASHARTTHCPWRGLRVLSRRSGWVLILVPLSSAAATWSANRGVSIIIIRHLAAIRLSCRSWRLPYKEQQPSTLRCTSTHLNWFQIRPNGRGLAAASLEIVLSARNRGRGKYQQCVRCDQRVSSILSMSMTL
jgi:hypothetical protein